MAAISAGSRLILAIAALSIAFWLVLLPLAMVILGVTLVPFLHGARVFTAYEFLERRFDPKTRTQRHHEAPIDDLPATRVMLTLVGVGKG